MLVALLAASPGALQGGAQEQPKVAYCTGIARFTKTEFSTGAFKLELIFIVLAAILILGVREIFKNNQSEDFKRDIEGILEKPTTRTKTQAPSPGLKRHEKVPHAPPPPIPESMRLAGPAWVIDGDTIAIRRVKIRLAGIDAPELDRPYGQKSKWAMVALCKGQNINVELTGETSYDRLVGTCYLDDGTDIGAELISAGLALDGGYFSKGKYRHLEPPGVRRRLKPFGNR